MNRGVWKYLVLMVGILFLSCAVVRGQDLGVLNYWDKFNLSDSTLYKPAGGLSEDDSFSVMETEAAHFFSLLKNCPDSVARVAVDNLMNKAVLASGGGFDAYGQIMGIAEKYFYNVQSPYYCEEMLLPFLDHKIARSDIPEIEKSREKFLAFMIRRNSVGHVAENFEYVTLKGEVCHLWDRFSEYRISITKPACNGNGDGEEYKAEKVHFPPIMVVFFTADCRDCREGIVSLSYSAIVRSLVKEKKLRVMAICTEGNLSSVSTIIPKDWIAGSDGGYIARNRLYSIRHTPSVYYMDKEGTVLLRDASVSSAIQFLLEQ